MTILYLSTL